MNMAGQLHMRYSEYQDTSVYASGEVAGVTLIVVAGLVSALSVIGVLIFLGIRVGKRIREPQFLHTLPIFISLMVGDFLQAFGSLLNAKWVLAGIVSPDAYCMIQGVIKQFGNVTIAVWSFIAAIHAFCMLFRRSRTTTTGLILKLVLGWSFVLFIVLLGPLALRRADRGPFYGVSGLWCWITSQYPIERVLLEYLIEFTSVALSFVIYGVLLLRIRGNLVRTSNGWRLRFVPSGESWKLAITRDAMDEAVLKTAHALIWYPVAYFVILVPVSITRFIDFAGHEVPLWAEVFTAVIFNLTGFVDALLLLRLRNFSPEENVLPALTKTKREKVDFKSGAALKVTPFVVGLGDEDDYSHPNIERTQSREPLV